MSRSAIVRIVIGLTLAFLGVVLLFLELVLAFPHAGGELNVARTVFEFLFWPVILIVSGALMVSKVVRDYNDDTA